MRQKSTGFTEPPVVTFYDTAGEIIGQVVLDKPSIVPEAPEGTVHTGVSTREWYDQPTKTPLGPGEQWLAARTEGRWQKVKHPPAVLEARAAHATS